MTRLLFLAFAAILAAPSASAQGCNIASSGGVRLSDIRPAPGQQITVSHVFVSVGSGPCPSVEVGHFLSTDDYLSDDDVLLGTVTLPASQPQSNLPASGTVTIPVGTPRGGYVMLAVADYTDAVPDDVQGDNVMRGGDFTIGGDLNGPNLTIATASLDETTAAPGGRVSFDYGVQNQGRSGVGDVRIGFYLRPINAPPSEWIPLGSETVGNVEAGETENENEEVTIPQTVPPARYALLVVADDGNAIEEFNETDNVLGAGLITITGNTAGESEPRVSVLSLAVSPNPAGASIRLAYALAEARTVRLVVSDALGREVAVVEGMRASGVHTEALDTAAWAPGVYVARLVAGAETAVQMLTVAR